MTDSTFKQLVFDCAMELLYGQEDLTNEQIGIKLLEYINLHDKANPVKSRWVKVNPTDMDYGEPIGTKL